MLLVVLVLAAGTGCRTEAGTDGDVTLTFWHSFVAATRPALDDLIRRFEAEHPGIRIRAQYVPTGDGLVQKLTTALQAGTPPDLSWVHADFLPRLADAGALHPLHGFIDGPDGLAPGTLGDIYPGLLESATWHDTLYALPMEATVLALLYNRTRFRQVGLDPDRPPATWDEFRAYTRRLTGDDDGDGRMDRYGFYVPVFPASGPLNLWMVLQWTPFLWQAGGTLIGPSGSTAAFDGDAGVQALALWRELYDMQDFRTFSQAHDLGFASGWLAMVLDGPWNLPRYRQASGLDWAVAPLPAGPAGSVTYLAGEHLAIFRNRPHPDAAWAFVKWVLRPEVQARFSMQSGYLPVRRTVLELPAYRAFLEEDAAMRGFVALLERGRARRPAGHRAVEINRHIGEAIERALVGQEDPARVLHEAAERTNRVLGGESF